MPSLGSGGGTQVERHDAFDRKAANGGPTASHDGHDASTVALQPGRYDFVVSVAAISMLPGGLATGLSDFRLEFSDVEPTPTPEPASLLLFASGAAALFVRRRRQARTQTP